MPFAIIVVGTGIAGLTAAIALSTKGHNITVVEATARLQPIGGTIVIQANASRALDSLGLGESLLGVCDATPLWPSTRRYKDGEILINKSPSTHKSEYGYLLRPFHRADLQQVLYDTALKRGVAVRLGCPVVSVDNIGEHVAITLKDGENIFADIVVGADGIKSTIRKSIVPDSKCVRDSGLDITRVNIPAAIVLSDPETAVFMDQICHWCGPFASIAAMPIRRGTELFLGLDCCHERDGTSVENAGRKQNMDRFQQHYKEFAPSIRKLLSFVDDAYVWRMMETRRPSWVSNCGRVVLIGDAAHAALPFAGQGGGMAIEDAVTLAECLERAVTRRDIPEALKTFQQIREPRCKSIQEWSAEKSRRSTLPDGPLQRQRDQHLKLNNSWKNTKPWNQVHVDEIPGYHKPNWKAWMCGHDAVQHANRELDKRFLARLAAMFSIPIYVEELKERNIWRVNREASAV